MSSTEHTQRWRYTQAFGRVTTLPANAAKMMRMPKVSSKNAPSSSKRRASTAPSLDTVGSEVADTNECVITGALVSCEPAANNEQALRVRIAVRNNDGQREILDCEVSRRAAVRTFSSMTEQARVRVQGSIRKRFWRAAGVGLVSRTYVEIHTAAKVR